MAIAILCYRKPSRYLQRRCLEAWGSKEFCDALWARGSPKTFPTYLYPGDKYLDTGCLFVWIENSRCVIAQDDYYVTMLAISKHSYQMEDLAGYLLRVCDEFQPLLPSDIAASILTIETRVFQGSDQVGWE